MFKRFFFIAICILIASACSQKKKNDDPGNRKYSKEENGVSDSYTRDTFYNALPGGLVDLSNAKDMVLLLAQNWVMEEDLETLRSADMDSKLMLPVRSFSMSPDFTVLKNCRNAMETGTWSFDEHEKLLTFRYQNGGGDRYKLRALAFDEMKLTNIGIKSESVLKFISDGKVCRNREVDPFAIGNNRWRIKPEAPENDESIKKRLKANIYFFILYYKDVIARRAEVVSFYGFPSCLNWYSGGIYLKQEEEIPEDWEKCFFNKAQARKAYKLMEGVMDKKYNWPKDKNLNWIKKNLFVLEQIYQQL